MSGHKHQASDAASKSARSQPVASDADRGLPDLNINAAYSASASAAHILRLQRTIGNQATIRFIQQQRAAPRQGSSQRRFNVLGVYRPVRLTSAAIRRRMIQRVEESRVHISFDNSNIRVGSDTQIETVMKPKQRPSFLDPGAFRVHTKQGGKSSRPAAGGSRHTFTYGQQGIQTGQGYQRRHLISYDRLFTNMKAGIENKTAKQALAWMQARTPGVQLGGIGVDARKGIQQIAFEWLQHWLSDSRNYFVGSSAENAKTERKQYDNPVTADRLRGGVFSSNALNRLTSNYFKAEIKKDGGEAQIKPAMTLIELANLFLGQDKYEDGDETRIIKKYRKAAIRCAYFSSELATRFFPRGIEQDVDFEDSDAEASSSEDDDSSSSSDSDDSSSSSDSEDDASSSSESETTDMDTTKTTPKTTKQPMILTKRLTHPVRILHPVQKSVARRQPVRTAPDGSPGLRIIQRNVVPMLFTSGAVSAHSPIMTVFPPHSRPATRAAAKRLIHQRQLSFGTDSINGLTKKVKPGMVLRHVVPYETLLLMLQKQLQGRTLGEGYAWMKTTYPQVDAVDAGAYVSRVDWATVPPDARTFEKYAQDWLAAWQNNPSNFFYGKKSANSALSNTYDNPLNADGGKAVDKVTLVAQYLAELTGAPLPHPPSKPAYQQFILTQGRSATRQRFAAWTDALQHFEQLALAKYFYSSTKNRDFEALTVDPLEQNSNASFARTIKYAAANAARKLVHILTDMYWQDVKGRTDKINHRFELKFADRLVQSGIKDVIADLIVNRARASKIQPGDITGDNQYNYDFNSDALRNAGIFVMLLAILKQYALVVDEAYEEAVKSFGGRV